MFEKKKNQKILVVVSHPDDESLGLGGTIYRHVHSGDAVYAVSMTDGVSSRDVKFKNILKKKRYRASLKVGKELGINWIKGPNFPDNAMDTVSLLKVTKFIEKVKEKITPSLIYTHSYSDLNIDHQIVNKATLTAFRPQPNELWTEIRTFEIPSSTDYGYKLTTGLFNPNLYIDITNYWKKKLEALKHYKMEMKDYPHSRSLEGLENLAKYRGNQVGLKYAEAFEVIRKIKR